VSLKPSTAPRNQIPLLASRRHGPETLFAILRYSSYKAWIMERPHQPGRSLPGNNDSYGIYLGEVEQQFIIGDM